MAKDSKKEILKALKQRKYLNKDFDSFKADLFEYNKTHHSTVNQDSSEPGIVGMFMEMAAYIGDVNSFYLDHQFHEINPEEATEDKNIEMHLRNAGVEIVGSSENSSDDAIRNALTKASSSIQKLRWFELIETRGSINEGDIERWQVTIKVGFTMNG